MSLWKVKYDRSIAHATQSLTLTQPLTQERANDSVYGPREDWEDAGRRVFSWRTTGFENHRWEDPSNEVVPHEASIIFLTSILG